MNSLLPISKHTPIKCEIKDNDLIIVYGIDIPHIFPHIVGSISLLGLQIEKATSKIFEQDTIDGSCFLDEFYIKTDQLDNEDWKETITVSIETQCLLVYQRKRQKALKKIIEAIVDSFVIYKEKKRAPPVIDIQLKEIKEKHQLSVIVQGEDYPFLLYALSLALEIQNLIIDSFFIETTQGYVSDTFNVRVPEDSDIDLESLRFRLILNTQVGFLLQNSPDPHVALQRFQSFTESFFLQDDCDIQDSRFLAHFLEILGSGDYLWEDFIRTQSNELIKIFSKKQQSKPLLKNSSYYKQKINNALKECDTYQEKVDLLNEIKDKEIYLIDVEVMFYHQQDFNVLSRCLSDLARAVISEACILIEQKLVAEHGVPRSTNWHKSDWALFGLGKMGGSALGYASDIELMFIYEDIGKTDGSNSISNTSFFEFFVNELATIIKARREGIFKIDLRLRPYGEAGPKAVLLNSFVEYYQSNKAHSIEKLSLTRLRPVTGNPLLAERVLTIKNNMLYHPHVIDKKEIFKMRMVQLKNKVKKGKRNAKFGRGALVDVEYCVQMLQVDFAQLAPALQHPSIHKALATLAQIEAISDVEKDMLYNAYAFYRKLINALRMRRGNAQDVTLPEEGSWELEHLARRMGYVKETLKAGESLLLDFDTISARVYAFIYKLFHTSFDDVLTQEFTSPGFLVYVQDIQQAKNLLINFEEPERAYQCIRQCAREGEIKDTFSRLLILGWMKIHQSGDPDLVFLMFNKLSEQFTDEQVLVFYQFLLDHPKGFMILVDLFATSKFLSEEIIKNTDYVNYLLNIENIRKQNTLELYQEHYLLFENTQYKLDTENLVLHRKNCLREFRKKEILRIIIRDVCQQAPLTSIYSEISYLAIAIIQQALKYATEELQVSSHGIAIFAFGKLGTRELNYSSDIDLMCVYDDTCTLDMRTIILLFQKTIKYLYEYTNKGISYRIDLRLRPFGENGDIVCHKQTLQEYYNTHAQLWEIQAALKLTGVAGDNSLIKECIEIIDTEIEKKSAQYDKKDILSEIHNLRIKSVEMYQQEYKKTVNIESTDKTQDVCEVKNTWGGIRDIEFGTQALQLLYYHRDCCHINTIQALHYLKEHKIISHAEYEENCQNYLFLRKVEHFLQVFEDQQLHTIPLKDKKFIKRLSWLLMQDSDEDVFLAKLSLVKHQAHQWYEKIFISHAYICQ